MAGWEATWIATIAFLMVSSVGAWRYASVHPRHVPVAALLTWLAIANVLRRVLAVLNAPAYLAAAGAPLTGWSRFNFHLDELLQVAWPVGLVAVGALVLVGEPRRRLAAWMAGGAWGLVSLVLVAGYPTIRRALLARVYLALEVVALAVVLAAGASWLRRGDRAALPEISIAVLVAVEFVALLRWSFDWDWPAYSYLFGYGGLAVLHVGAAISSSPLGR